MANSKWMWGVLLAAVALAAPARADGDATQVVAVRTDRPGEVVLYVVDPEARRLLVYRHMVGHSLQLEAVRNYEYELRFEQFTPHGSDQSPSVKEIRDQVQKGAPRNTLPALVERELDLLDLRERLGPSGQGGEQPTWRGKPLAEHVKQLEQELIDMRLELTDEQGYATFQRNWVEALNQRRDTLQQRIRARQELEKRLPQDHAGRATVERQLMRLRRQLARLDELIKAEGVPQAPDTKPLAPDEGAPVAPEGEPEGGH